MGGNARWLRVWWKVMAAYRLVYGFGHLQADCWGLGLAPEPYARFEYGTTFTFTVNTSIALWKTGDLKVLSVIQLR